MASTIWTLIIGIPGCIWSVIQIFRYFKTPDAKVPEPFNATAELPSSGDERVLVKFDMARAMMPGSLENRISAILRDVPHDDQMPLLVFPEYVREKKQSSWELWSGLTALYISFLPWVYFSMYLFISTRDLTPRQLFFEIAIVIALPVPPTLTFRKALRAKRLARRAVRFIELQNENGLRLAFEWTASKTPVREELDE
jgi:hypothetical protein